MTTSVPVPDFGPKGFIAPLESQILQGVMVDINVAFGGGLNPALDTPQGQLATSMTAIIGNCNDTFLKYTQQVDPSYADGRMQDGIARIYFIERLPSLSTVVQAHCLGLAGVVIPVGTVAQAVDGNVYSCDQDGTIGANGSVTLQFSCNTPGAIACPAGALSAIYQTIPGWDSITNLTDGVIGRDVETRRDFETRRFDSVANNALGFLPSVLGAVLQIDGVLDSYVTENFTGSPVVVGGVTLVARSLYVAAVGGLDEDIAKAIWKKKAPGCNYNGNTTVTVYDDVSGYDPPLPSYEVKFERPSSLPVLFSVTIANNPQVPADAATQIQDAIIAAFAGQDGGPRARIASVIYASRFYAPVAALGSWVQIVAIDVGSLNTPSAVCTGSTSGGTLTVTALTSGTLGAGMFLSGSAGGSDIVVGTQIVAQLSGSVGGTGTYSISIEQTVPEATIKASSPNQNSVTSQIDQSPAVSAVCILVSTA